MFPSKCNGISLSLQGGIGLNVAQMIVELIRDKRKIVDRITKNHLDIYIELLRSHQVQLSFKTLCKTN